MPPDRRGPIRSFRPLPHGPEFDEGREKALEVLDFIVRLVRDPERLERVGRIAQEGWQRDGALRHWDSVSVDFGPLAAALFATQLDAVEPNRGWSNLAKVYLDKLAGLHAPSRALSLFASPLALGFVLGLRNEQARHDGKTATASMEPFVSYVRDRLHDPPPQDPLSSDTFDLISGLAGACLFMHGVHEAGVADAGPIHRTATIELASVAWPTGLKETPPYWVRPENLPTAEHRIAYPNGCMDLGVAHGISGVLLALSLLPETLGTARALIDQLASSVTKQPVPWWPNAVGRPGDAGTSDRFAWCYGTPGISRTLFLSAEFLDHAPARELALRAARGVASRVMAGATLPEPGICHGNAGLLQVMVRFGSDVGEEVFWDAGLELVGRIHAMYDPVREAGFLARAQNGTVSSPCLLNGALGIGLALLSAVEGVEPKWDRLFGLSVAGTTTLAAQHAPS